MECGKYTYQVQPREVDLKKRATIMGLGDSILHTAGEDADRNGFGIRLLHKENKAWVLSRMAIEVDRYPNEYETYTITTWVNEVGRLMTVRNFVLHDAQGVEMARAITQWAMIDMQTRQALDLRTNLTYAQAVIGLESPMERPRRIANVVPTEQEHHRIRYSDIDFNQHTNSMRYVQWMVDMLTLEELTTNEILRLDINFQHETRYGQEVDILLQRTSDDALFEVTHAEQIACKASITWR